MDLTKKTLPLIFFLVSLLVAGNAEAQTKHKKKKEDSGGGTSQKIEIIQKNDYFDDGKKSQSSLSNLIKINPALYINGEYPLFYERKFSDNLTGEIGIGPTYRNYLFDVIHYGTSVDGVDYFTKSTAQIGFTIRSEVRYYLEANDFPEGSYFALGLRHKTHIIDFGTPTNYSYPYNQPVTAPLRGTNYFTDVVVMYGYQKELDNNFYVDYYIGLGVRKKSISDVQVINIPDPNGGSIYNTIPTYSIVSTSSTVSIFTIGTKIGLAF